MSNQAHLFLTPATFQGLSAVKINRGSHGINIDHEGAMSQATYQVACFYLDIKPDTAVYKHDNSLANNRRKYIYPIARLGTQVKM